MIVIAIIITLIFTVGPGKQSNQNGYSEEEMKLVDLQTSYKQTNVLNRTFLPNYTYSYLSKVDT